MPMQLTVLGTGSATPTLWRNPTAQVLDVAHEYYLIDCAEGTQTELLKNKIRPGRLKYIFISHLHGDHYFGLIGLLTSLSLGKRTDDLFLIGPPGLMEVLTLQLKLSDTRLSFQIHFTEVRTGESYQVFENQYLTVYTIPLIHRIHCSGYLFREKTTLRKIIRATLPEDLSIADLKALKQGQNLVDDTGGIRYKNEDLTTEAIHGKSYAFCSDTIYNENIISLIEGVDLLYHEATFEHSMLEWANKTFHTTALQAATIAQKANVKALMIGHFSSRYKTTDHLLAEAQTVFENTILAKDGLVIDI